MKLFFKRFFRTIAVLILIIIIIVGALILFRNPIADFIIEKTGSAAAGAKVEVDGIYLEPFKLNISWERLQVTDKNDTWKNLFETSQCQFILSFKPLLDKKVIIEQMKIAEVKINTKRSSDGKLSVKKSKPKKPSKLMLAIKRNIEAEKSNIPVFKAKELKTEINVDTIIEMLEFETPAKADSIKKIAEKRYTYWNDLIENNNYESRAKKIENDVKKIDVEHMKTFADFQRNLNLAKTSYDSSKELYNEFKTQKSQLENDLFLMKNLKKDIPKWIDSDYKNALNKAKLQDINVQNVALMLFGERVTDGLLLVMEQIEKSRQLTKNETVKESRKEKMPHLPNFWIKDIDLSVITPDNLKLSGRILDISSDQKKTKLPLKINLKGNQDKIGKISLAGIFDYRDDEGSETIHLNIIDVPIKNVEISNFDLLPSKLTKGTAKIKSNFNLRDDMILATIDLHTNDIKFDYSTQTDLDKNLVRISRNITEAINEVDLQVEIEQREKNFKFKLNSNLDNLIAGQLKKVASDEVKRAKAELETRVKKELDKYKVEAQKVIDEKTAQLQKELNKVNKEIDKQLQVVEDKKKDIEDRVEEEKQKLQNQAEDEVEDALDDVWDKLKF